jgi:NNP family nitrate/nitrite transporter-like MFS transporter
MTTRTPSPPDATAAPPLAPPTSNPLQLTLATGGFAVCFAIFGSISAMMPIIRQNLGLTPMQVSVAIAVPVVLGSLGRIPLGMLTDRYGGRLMFSITMLVSIVPAVAVGFVNSYVGLLVCGFFAGVALASFSVGVGFVTRWYAPQRHGTALGIYGAGNIGQSLAAVGAPFFAGVAGYAWGFWAFALLTAAWLALFVLLARDAPGPRPRKTLGQLVAPLADVKSWLLGTYYFLTFGGFVAMSVYLPTFLTDIFALTPADAGRRTAGFVLFATVMRPVGGMLADRIGGRRVLAFVFPATAVFAVFLACPMMSTFTVGALGMAAAIGLGNGAVFKLVPQYFPKDVGSVTGLVGAAGGLGGFFPPLLVGVLRQTTGHYAWGFILLSLFALFCLFLLWRAGRTLILPAAEPT